MRHTCAATSAWLAPQVTGTLPGEPAIRLLSVDCLLYARVSTEEQAETGYSLDTQEKLCRDFAERSGYRVAGVFRDEGKSGTTLDRPALQDLLAKCTKGTTVNAVIVQETDRLARNTHDHLTIRALLQKANVKLISVAQPMLDDSPEGKMIDTILASVNQFQSDISGRKVRKALQEKFNQGWWPGWAPLGYVNVAIGDSNDGQRIRKIVKRDPKSWSILQEGFRLYLTGSYSADEIRDLLHEKGIRSKTGKKIAHSIMVNTLKNPFYAGLMVWHGQRRMGRHEPIITIAEHQRILQIIGSHNLHASRRRKHNFLLRGFALCNLCGQRYTAEIHPSKNKSYYHCASMRKHSNRHQNVEAVALERQVGECFKNIRFSPRFVRLILHKLTVVSANYAQRAHTRKQILLNQQRAIEAKRDRAEEKLLAGVLSDDAFVRLRARFTEQLQGIGEQLATLASERECNTDVIREVLRLSGNVYEAYKNAPDALKRQYLGLFWEQFRVQDREVVEAVPSRLIRDLQREREVILSSNWRASPTLIITLQDSSYIKALRERLLAIKAFQTAKSPVGDHHDQRQAV
jgi:DNA invertase Pin-like site-specific DNA recombinase